MNLVFFRLVFQFDVREELTAKLQCPLGGQNIHKALHILYNPCSVNLQAYY